MKLSTRRVMFVVALTIAALGGLVWLQVSLLDYALVTKEQTFKNQVRAALDRVSQQLSFGEAMTLAVRASGLHAPEGHTPGEQVQVMAFVAGTESEFSYSWVTGDAATEPAPDSCPVTIEDGRVIYDVPSPQHVSLSAYHLVDSTRLTLVDEFRDSGRYEIELDSGQLADGPVLWTYRSDSTSRVLRIQNRSFDTVFAEPDSAKQRLASTVVERLFAAELTPVEDRLDSTRVDSLVSATMAQAGIDLDFAYGIHTMHDDSLHYVTPPSAESDIRWSDLKTRLFPQDMFAPPSYLSVYFPERRSYLWGQIMPLVAAEVIFMLIIVATFAYTIRTILRQRRFASMLVDFINNMTHEFKTPISTVSLATEAIARPDVQADRGQIVRFNEMIKSEVARMRSQAEKILQMAALEEGDIRLESEHVDVHDIVRDVAAPVTLQVEHHGGTVRCDLLAAQPVVRGDRLHLANIISNLLDNAVKYSSGAPEILVATADRPDGLVVLVQDHGIGMRPEEQKQAFHKYYRVPTGNRHDVKGFGLGLSYVKLMVEAHGGNVALSSRPGEGTRVEFVIPRAEHSDQGSDYV